MKLATKAPDIPSVSATASSPDVNKRVQLFISSLITCMFLGCKNLQPIDMPPAVSFGLNPAQYIPAGAEETPEALEIIRLCALYERAHEAKDIIRIVKRIHMLSEHLRKGK
jgi:hypothetical protein